jgi:O-antigen ligase
LLEHDKIIALNDRIFWIALLWFMVLSIPIGAIITPRSFEIISALDTMEANAGGIWSVSRIVFTSLTLGFTSLCILVVLINITKIRQRFSSYPFSLRFFSIGLALSPMLATFAAGDFPRLKYLALFFLLLATFTLYPIDPIWFVRKVRISFLTVFIYGSLFAIIFMPSWAIQSDYESSLAIFNARLFGTTNHANALGPFALAVVVLGYFPCTRLKGEQFHQFSSLLVLLLTQSKTTWFISFICLLAILCWKLSYLHKSFSKSLLISAFTSLSICIFCIVARWLVLLWTSLLNDVDVTTLTGRLLLWFYSWEYWLESPWLGHGYSAWDSNKILENLQLFSWAAPNAHNQFLQSLTEGGILAEVFLIGFFYIVIYFCIKARGSGRILLFLLSTIVIFRSFTEVTIDCSLGSSLLLTWVLIVVMGSHTKIARTY